MNFTLIYVPNKEDERIETTETEFVCYSNSPDLLEDFQILKNLGKTDCDCIEFVK